MKPVEVTQKEAFMAGIEYARTFMYPEELWYHEGPMTEDWETHYKRYVRKIKAVSGSLFDGSKMRRRQFLLPQ